MDMAAHLSSAPSSAPKYYFELLPEALKNRLPAKLDMSRVVAKFFLSQLPGFYFAEVEVLEGKDEFMVGMVHNRDMPMLEWGHRVGLPLSADLILDAAYVGDEELVKWLRGIGCQWDASTLSSALYHGHLKLGRWIAENGCPIEDDEQTCSLHYLFEMADCDKETFEYFKKLGVKWSTLSAPNTKKNLKRLQSAVAAGCPLSMKLMANAVTYGTLEMVQWLQEQQCPWDEWYWKNACYNDTDCLALLEFGRRNGVSLHPFGAWGLITAIEMRHHDAIKWFLAHGIPWRKDYAAKVEWRDADHSETVRWMVNSGYSLELMPAEHCRKSFFPCVLAAKDGDLEFLKRARAQKIPWGGFAEAAIQSDRFEMLEWALENGLTLHSSLYSVAVAAESNSLDSIMWLRAKKVPWTASEAEKMAQLLSDDAFDWVLAQGLPLSDALLWGAAFGNDFQRLKFLKAKGLAWTSSACAGAAQGNRFELLRRLYSDKVPLDNSVAIAAVKSWNLEILQWCISRGCEMRAELLVQAILTRNLMAVDWLIKNGCPKNASCCVAAVKARNCRLLNWLIEKKCHCDWEACWKEEQQAAQRDRDFDFLEARSDAQARSRRRKAAKGRVFFVFYRK